MFEISPLQAILLTVYVRARAPGLKFALTLFWVLCFVMDYVHQFGETAHKRVHYYGIGSPQDKSHILNSVTPVRNIRHEITGLSNSLLRH